MTTSESHSIVSNLVQSDNKIKESFSIYSEKLNPDQLHEIKEVTDSAEDESQNRLELNADDTVHYDNDDNVSLLSDSVSYHSPIDEDEEKKFEVEIANNLSHLKINRNQINNKFNLFSSFNHQELDYINNNNDIEEEELDGNDEFIGVLDDDDDDDINNKTDDEQSLYNNNYPSIRHKNDNFQPKYRFSLFKEFIGNESFLKYLMLYSTMFIISRQSLNRYYSLTNNNNSVDITDINRMSTKVVIIINGIITTFKGHNIWNKPYSEMIFKSIKNKLNLTENEANVMEIQKAFYIIMIILSYFSGKAISKNKLFGRYLYRLYNVLCVGAIILIKKYKEYGSLFLYTSFWVHLSSLFINSSKILKLIKINNYKHKLIIKYLYKSTSILFSLIMLYSRLILFPKIIIPIIQFSYRNKNNQKYFKVVASIIFLLSGFYKTGKALMNTMISLKKQQ